MRQKRIQFRIFIESFCLKHVSKVIVTTPVNIIFLRLNMNPENSFSLGNINLRKNPVNTALYIMNGILYTNRFGISKSFLKNIYIYYIDFSISSYS